MPAIRRQLKIETLEPRRCLSSVWQNADNRLDIDNSSLVDAADLVHLADLIDREGVRLLPSVKPVDEAFCDVNGDGYITPLDLLSLINGLNKFNAALQLSASLSQFDDVDRNGVTLNETVQIVGQTLPGVSVQIASVPNADDGSRSILATVESSDDGRFEIEVQLVPGRNTFELLAHDPLGRTTSIQQEIRRGDLITNWNATVMNVVRGWNPIEGQLIDGVAASSPPPLVARNLAMIHTAMFDAMNGIGGEYTNYVAVEGASSYASSEAAAVAAAYRVSSALYTSPGQRQLWESAFAESLAAIPDGMSKTAGIDYGYSVADAMLALRAADGSAASLAYNPIDEPGHWRPTAPASQPFLLPHWGTVAPFGSDNLNDFAAPPPPALTSAEYLEAVDEVMRLGGADSAERTAEQSAIAVFWADGAGTVTPPGHWNQIAADVLMSQPQSTLEHARVLALLNLSLADAVIAAWQSKLHYDLWRPIDAIEHLNSGSGDASSDIAWSPLLVTPPFPAYTSGHSTFSGAAAAVLTSLLGDVSFTSFVDPHTAANQQLVDPSLLGGRTFTSFAEAAAEAGLSRIYGGIHYNFDNTAGLAMGRAIGEHIVMTIAK